MQVAIDRVASACGVGDRPKIDILPLLSSAEVDVSMVDVLAPPRAIIDGLFTKISPKDKPTRAPPASP